MMRIPIEFPEERIRESQTFGDRERPQTKNCMRYGNHDDPRAGKWRQFRQEEVADFLLGLAIGIIIGLLSRAQPSAESGAKTLRIAKQS